MRRTQIVLVSARGLSPQPIAPLGGGCVQTVRNVIRAFHTTGLACVSKPSTRPKSVEPTLNAATCERLPQLLHQSPRTYGKSTGVWTLALAAQVCHEQGMTARCRRDATIHRALQCLRTNWKRAKHWLTSPDAQYTRQEGGVSVAEQEPVAQSDRAQRDPGEASEC